MTQPTAGEAACSVCGEPLQPQAQADCYSCGRLFHLGLTTSAEVDDCGQVWIDDQVLALQFACNRCLDEHLEEHTDEQGAAVEESPPPPAEAAPRVQRAEPGRSAREIARRRRSR